MSAFGFRKLVNPIKGLSLGSEIGRDVKMSLYNRTRSARLPTSVQDAKQQAYDIVSGVAKDTEGKVKDKALDVGMVLVDKGVNAVKNVIPEAIRKNPAFEPAFNFGERMFKGWVRPVIQKTINSGFNFLGNTVGRFARGFLGVR